MAKLTRKEFIELKKLGIIKKNINYADWKKVFQ